VTSTYASIRQTTPDVSFAAAAGGSLTGSGSIWLCIQARNRAGRNLLSTPVQVSYSAGQKIACTIGTGARATGEEIIEYVISGFSSNTPSSMKRLASWRAKDAFVLGATNYPGQGNDRPLPHTIDLTHDAHLLGGATVINSDALPTNRINGMIRFVTSEAEYWRYDDEAESGELAAGSGYWVVSSAGELSSYQASTTDAGGCDRPLLNLSPADVLSPPAYAGDGSDSYPVQLWYSNGLTDDGGAVNEQGYQLALQIRLDGANKSTLFSGRVVARLLGYVDRSTGILDEAIASVGDDIVLSAADSPDDTPRLGNLTLPLELLRGNAAVYALFFRFNVEELTGQWGDRVLDGSQFTTILYPEGLLGNPDKSWNITGDVIFNVTDRMRVLPTQSAAVRSAGQCMIQGFSSPSVAAQLLIGIAADTADQQVVISAALAGDALVRAPGEPLGGTDGLRALISTLPGEWVASDYTSTVSVSGAQVIQLSITYPDAIRDDYPDVIKGAIAAFNVPSLRIYIQQVSTGDIYRLTAEPIPTAPSQTLTLQSLAGSVVGALPSSPASEFCLFDYGTIGATVASGSGSFPADDYRVAIAYWFPSPSTAVTAISHDTVDGCIPEIEPLTTLIESGKYWGAAVATVAQLTALEGVTDNQYRFCEEVGYRCRYDATSLELADDVTIFEPDDGIGRWFAEVPISLVDFYSFA
jgi:hypothetical protein